MPELYGDELDRQKLWERISNGVVTSLSKANMDWERFINEILIYIKADAVSVSNNEKFKTFLDDFLTKDETYRTSWLRCFETRNMILIPFARHAWGLVKSVPRKNKTGIEAVMDKAKTVKQKPYERSAKPVTEDLTGGLF